MNEDQIISVLLGDLRTYLHYTDSTGLSGIIQQGVIRTDAKGYVYLTQEPMSPAKVAQNLFIGASTHAGRGTHILVMRLDDGIPVERCGYYELRCRQSIRLDQHRVVYSGENPFRS